MQTIHSSPSTTDKKILINQSSTKNLNSIKSSNINHNKIHKQMRHLQFLTNFDTSPSTLTLHFNKISTYKTKTSGFFSLLSYLVIVFITVYKIYDVVSLNHISVQSQITMTDYIQPIDISDMVFSLLLIVRTETGAVQINDGNKYQHGINVTLQQNYQYLENGKIIQIPSYYPMHSDPDNFYTIKNTPNIDTKLLGRIDFFNPKQKNGDIYKRLAIRVNKCDPDQSPQCKPYKSNVKAALIFRNNKIDPYSLNYSEIVEFDPAFRVFQMISPLNRFQCFSLTYFFKAVNITTDSSILPQIIHSEPNQNQLTNISTWIYDNEYTEQTYNFGEQNTDLLKLALKRSEYSVYYRRSYKKLDMVLAQVFGLVGLVFLIRGVIVGGYTQWRFGRDRVEFMRNGSEGEGEGEGKRRDHIGKYCLERLKNFFKCFCIKCGKNQNENQPYLDYHQLLLRVEQLQSKITQNQISQHPTTQQQEKQNILNKQDPEPEAESEQMNELEQNLLEKERGEQANGRYSLRRVSIN